jgi:hypothetical protein
MAISYHLRRSALKKIQLPGITFVELFQVIFMCCAMEADAVTLSLPSTDSKKTLMGGGEVAELAN